MEDNLQLTEIGNEKPKRKRKYRDRRVYKNVKPIGDIKPWEQQPNESYLDYQAFKTYRDMGLERSYIKTAEILDRPSRTLYHIGYRWKWGQRIYEYDVHLEKLALKLKEREIEEMFKRHSTHSQAIESAMMVPVQKFLKKIKTMPETEFEQMTLNALLSLVYQTADRFPKIVDTERKSRGVATDISKQSIDHTSKGEHLDFKGWLDFKVELTRTLEEFPESKEQVLKVLDKITEEIQQ